VQVQSSFAESRDWDKEIIDTLLQQLLCFGRNQSLLSLIINYALIVINYYEACLFPSRAWLANDRTEERRRVE